MEAGFAFIGGIGIRLRIIDTSAYFRGLNAQTGGGTGCVLDLGEVGLLTGADIACALQIATKSEGTYKNVTYGAQFSVQKMSLNIGNRVELMEHTIVAEEFFDISLRCHIHCILFAFFRQFKTVVVKLYNDSWELMYVRSVLCPRDVTFRAQNVRCK